MSIDLTVPMPASSLTSAKRKWAVRARALKAEQYSPMIEPKLDQVYRETLTVRAAQRIVEAIRLVDLIHALARIGRVNPDRVASSVVDLECTSRRSR